MTFFTNIEPFYPQTATPAIRLCRQSSGRSTRFLLARSGLWPKRHTIHRRRRYLFDSHKQQSRQFNTNSNRAGLPENPKVNNAMIKNKDRTCCGETAHSSCRL